MKSDSDSKSRPHRKRTLSRWVDFRGFEESDIKYLWASYKKDHISGILKYIPENLSVEEFKEAITQITLTNFNYVWVMLAPNKKELPIGIIYGRDFGQSIVVGEMTWFLWASPRNILESVLNFINEMRKECHLIGTSEFKDKQFFEHMCRYGVTRRVGTLQHSDIKQTVFESRKYDG